MRALLLVVRIALAASLGIAAIAKLSSARTFRASLREFGLPGRAAEALGLLVPLAELGAAVLLLPASSAWLGGVVSLVLLMAFSGAVLVMLATGRTPDCPCFGQILPGPIGWHTLARNAIFIAGALLVVLAGSHEAQASPVAWYLPGVLGLAALVCCAIVLARSSARRRAARVERRRRFWAWSQTLRSGTQRAATAPSPRGTTPTDEAAPAFTLPAISGGQVSLDDLRRAGLPIILVFVSPTCGRCRTLWPRLAEWQRECGASLTVAIVSKGGVAANRELVERHRLSDVLLEEHGEVARAYRAGRLPAAVLITAAGRLGSTIVSDVASIHALVSVAHTNDRCVDSAQP